MSQISTFPLPFTGLELPRFLLTLDQTLAAMPGARVTFVEVDALVADEPTIAVIEVTMHRSVVERYRAHGDPELPDDEEEYWTAEIALVEDGEETTLSVDLERNMYVMPALVKILEDVLGRLQPSAEDDEDEESDEYEDDEDEYEDDEDEYEDDEDEYEDDEDEYDDEFEDEDGEDDSDEFAGEEEAEDEDEDGDAWDAAEAFEALRGMAENTFGEANLEGERSFVFPIKWEDPPVVKHVRVRAFVPTVAMGKGEQASWVAIECEVCPREKLPPEIAVALNTEVDFPLLLEGDTYLMSQSFALRSVDGSLFVEMAIALAEQSDMLNEAIEQGILQNT